MDLRLAHAKIEGAKRPRYDDQIVFQDVWIECEFCRKQEFILGYTA